jgi:hypothetical protein
MYIYKFEMSLNLLSAMSANTEKYDPLNTSVTGNFEAGRAGTVASGADVNQVGPPGRTPMLHFTSRMGHTALDRGIEKKNGKHTNGILPM